MKITEEQKAEIKSAMLSVWDAIAPDLLNTYSHPEAEMPRDEVIDVLLDKTYEGNWEDASRAPSKAASAAWEALSTKAQTKLMKEWFPCKTYG